jgi:hypothetical protein
MLLIQIIVGVGMHLPFWTEWRNCQSPWSVHECCFCRLASFLSVYQWAWFRSKAIDIEPATREKKHQGARLPTRLVLRGNGIVWCCVDSRTFVKSRDLTSQGNPDHTSQSYNSNVGDRCRPREGHSLAHDWQLYVVVG